MSIMEITHKGISLDIEFDYTPEERQTFFEPGYSERVDFITAWIGAVDVSELLRADDKNAIEETILRRIRSDREDAELEIALSAYESRITYHEMHTA